MFQFQNSPREAVRQGLLQIWTNGGVFLQLYVRQLSGQSYPAKMKGLVGKSLKSTEQNINGNFRILKWRYCTI